jgi:hypothetical protein
MSSVGLKSSTIEVFRTRNHGNKILRIYKFNADGETLSTLFTIHRGFFIGENAGDTTEGAAQFILTIDTGYSQGLTGVILGRASWVDLINPDTGDRQRFRMTTGNMPLLDDYRFIYGLHAAMNDTKAIL